MNRDTAIQRWLALGLLILVLAVLSFVVVIPLLSQGLAYQEQKQELIFRLQKMHQIAAKESTIEAQLEQLHQQFKQQGYFGHYETAALASAGLQKFVKTLVADAGGQLNSTQVLPMRERDDLTEIVVQVRMKGDIKVLRDVLHGIETSIPVKMIKQLDIRPVRGKRNRKTRKIEPSNQLNIRFQVVSFLRQQS
ncbi:type II secretion system protein GspM [methane-oxidizing endosymbiont of Gigantopelta aegis]|uniref:type II secretion system protein GspM n=1 Tax=methane-oxidizing endosymbiont of Gigantopelta aegis TaxID=2794938 RepID=UPI0018DD4E85|nr:type II secretion system protein GspM [methane-oxidizing endosymbiont of Gigantopelta aegis]